MFWKGVVGYLPVNIVQALSGLLAIVVFTRVLTPDQYGAYAIAFSVMSLVHTLLFTWLEAAMARFYAAEARGDDLPHHYATLYRLFAVLAVAFPLLAAPILWLWPMQPMLKGAIAAGLVSIMCRCLARLAQERRRAAGDVKGAALLEITQSGGGFVIGGGLALLGFGASAPLWGIAAGAAVCLTWALPVELKHGEGGKFEAARARAYAAYGLPVSLSLVLALVLSTTDRFLLAGYLNETAVGVYHAGYSLANRTLDVMFIWLGMAAGPAAIAALERGGREALDKAAREQSSFMVLLALPASVGLALVARPLADVMVGEGLRAGAAQVTPWIAASAFLAGVTTYYFHTAFTLARRTKLLFVVMAIPAGANVVLNLLLIPRFGLSGAMWATTASFALGAISSYSLGRRVLPLPVPWDTLARAGVAAAVMALLVSRLPAWGGVGELAAKAAAGVAVYGVMAWLLDAAGMRSRTVELAGLLRSRRPA